MTETNELSNQPSCDHEIALDQRLTFDATNVHVKEIKNIFILFGMIVLFSVFYGMLLVFLKLHDGISFFPVMCGIVILSLCFGFVIAFRKRKIAKQVILEFDAIIIKYYVWSKRLKYESITKIYHQCDLPLDKPPYPEGLLILLDWNGKIIGRIPMTMTDFEILETELLRRIQNATGKQVYRREEELIEKRRNKKKIRQELTISAGLMFLGLCCMSILLIRDHWNYSKERSRYGSIEATMKQHPFFDNTDKNIHRLEYSFTVDEKEYTNTRTFNETEWANLKGKETITVYYIPNNPHDNFLERDIHYSVTIANLTFRWVSLGFYFVTMCIVFFRVLGYNFKTYNGITYLLKPDQILEDRLDELAKHSNKPFSS